MLTPSEAKLLHALKTRGGREKHDAFTVEGVRVVEEALAARIDLKFAVISTSLEDGRRGQSLVQQLTARTTVQRVSDGQLRQLAETDTPQGVIVVARPPHATLADVKLPPASVVLVIDAVQDPGNLGTLIRTAAAFAVTGVIALPGTVDYWNSKVVRSAAGASFQVPLVNAAEAETWDWLARNTFTVCGADMSGVPVAQAGMAARVALVVGNEGAGLRKATRTHVQCTVSIPMPGRAESLNVAAAAAILLYELSNRADS